MPIQTPILVSRNSDPYKNLAIEEYLMNKIEEDEILLFLWSNDNTIVIGRNQNAWTECKVEQFLNTHGKIARRKSGGGCVYHDSGNLNFSFIAKKPLYNVTRQMEVIAKAVGTFGLNAQVSGRNDITINGSKFSGNAFYDNGHTHCHHGTILIEANMSKLGQFLCPKNDKLASKGVKSVRSRVVNLCELNPAAIKPRVVSAILKSFAAEYKSTLTRYSPTRLSSEKINELAKFNASNDWIFATKQALANMTHEISHRFDWGCFELQLQVNSGKIAQATVYSDALDGELFAKLGNILTNINYNYEELENAVAPLATTSSKGQVLADVLTILKKEVPSG